MRIDRSITSSYTNSMVAKLFSGGALIAEVEMEKPQPFIHLEVSSDIPSGVLDAYDDAFLRAAGIVPDLVVQAGSERVFRLIDVRSDGAVYEAAPARK